MTLVIHNQQLLTIVATGGVTVPKPAPALVMAWLTCGNCGQQYPLRPGATALLLGDTFAQVRPGFVEVCPHCFHEHLPASRLAMGEKYSKEKYMSNQVEFNEWAILELMGHIRLAGLVSEEERFGAKLGRIDIPDGDGFTTQYFGASSVYRLTPTTEDIARAVAIQNQPRPVHRWELPSPNHHELGATADDGTYFDEDADDIDF